MKIGAQLYTVSKYCQTLDGFADSLAKVADMGYKAVQVSGVCPYEPEWLKEQLDKNGLICELTHPSMDEICNPDKTVAEHNVYGCKYIGVSIMPQKNRDSIEHAGEFCDRFDEASIMDYIINRFPTEDLGITLDTYWVEYAGVDVLGEIKRLSGRIPRIHLKDMEILEDGTKRYAPVGSGVMNFEKICAAAVEAGTEYAFVEQDNCFGKDPFECLRKSLEYLKSIGYQV